MNAIQIDRQKSIKALAVAIILLRRGQAKDIVEDIVRLMHPEAKDWRTTDAEAYYLPLPVGFCTSCHTYLDYPMLAKMGCAKCGIQSPRPVSVYDSAIHAVRLWPWQVHNFYLSSALALIQQWENTSGNT